MGLRASPGNPLKLEIVKRSDQVKGFYFLPRRLFVERITGWLWRHRRQGNRISVSQIIEYYGARWKIETAFKELKQDIGSSETQTRHPVAVMNHLHFCMMATSVAWIYASRLAKTPNRRHVVKGRNHFSFSDVRRSVAKAAMDDNFGVLFPVPTNLP
jgi:IS4 transposase